MREVYAISPPAGEVVGCDSFGCNEQAEVMVKVETRTGRVLLCAKCAARMSCGELLIEQE